MRTAITCPEPEPARDRFAAWPLTVESTTHEALINRQSSLTAVIAETWWAVLDVQPRRN